MRIGRPTSSPIVRQVARSTWVATGHWRLGAACLAAGLLLVGCSDEGATPQVPSIDSDAVPTAGAEPGLAAEGAEVEAYLELRQDLAECFRNNGLPDTEDPDELGVFTVQIGAPGADKALTACQELGLATREVPKVIQEQIEARRLSKITPQEKQFEIDFADCMHENGISEWPDPPASGDRPTPDWEQPDATSSAPDGLQEVMALCNRKLGNGPPS